MDVTAWLTGVGGPWVYAVIAICAFLESAAFIGLLVPGETVVLLGGVLAGTGQVDLVGVVLVAAVGAVAGDQAGYSFGRALGPRLRTGRLGRRLGPDRWARAEDVLARSGGPAVFLARWIGVLRAVVPAAAGAGGMPRSVFTGWNAVGGVSWSTAVVGVGFLAGASWPSVQHTLGLGVLVVAAVGVALVAVALAVRAVLRRRAAHLTATS